MNKRLLWLMNDGFSHTSEEVGRHLSDIDLLRVSTTAEAVARTQEADCLLLSVPLAEADILLLSAAIPVICWLDDLTPGTAVRMLRAGAVHCFDSSPSVEEVCGVVRDAMNQCAARVTKQPRGEQPEKWRASLVGESAVIEKLAATIRLIAPRKCTVLIAGETGTGKEMTARAIHLASPRAHLPMVAVNCAALPENLLEAELFGHTRGAFTGANTLRIGRFEQANKGTLFLDEIGEMPLDLQAKLLRVLQEKELQRLGSSETIQVDVRIIAASNVDLEARVREGKFRADLYYRLNVVPLVIPPLRARKEDIPMLVNHFVRKVCGAEGIALKQVAPVALDLLCGQSWPGNIRQLENAVEMAVALSGDRTVLDAKDFGLHALPAVFRSREAAAEAAASQLAAVGFDKAVSQFQLALLNDALQKSEGNRTIAAERLGIKRTTLVMKLKQFGGGDFPDMAAPAREFRDLAVPA